MTNTIGHKNANNSVINTHFKRSFGPSTRSVDITPDSIDTNDAPTSAM